MENIMILQKRAGTDQLQTSYNIRGWLTKSSNSMFTETLEYERPTASGAVAQYGGNISAVQWTSGSTETFRYTYDGQNRLTESAYKKSQ